MPQLNDIIVYYAKVSKYAHTQMYTFLHNS